MVVGVNVAALAVGSLVADTFPDVFEELDGLLPVPTRIPNRIPAPMSTRARIGKIIRYALPLLDRGGDCVCVGAVKLVSCKFGVMELCCSPARGGVV